MTLSILSPSYLDEAKLDTHDVRIQTHLPVYISMSTIPSRLNNTIKIIKNTLKHLSGIEQLILNVPYQYYRFPEFKVDENYIRNEITDNRFYLNRTRDYGPLSKLLPTLSLIPDNSILIICDDMCYKLSSFKDIAEKQAQYLNRSFTYFYYPYSQNNYNHTINVPQGADMISFYTRNIQSFPEWFSGYLKTLGIDRYFDNPCFFVDDQVIGFFLQYMSIPIQQVDPGHRMIYIKHCDNAPKKDNLNKQIGKNSRENTMKYCYQDLHKAFSIPGDYE